MTTQQREKLKWTQQTSMSAFFFQTKRNLLSQLTAFRLHHTSSSSSTCPTLSWDPHAFPQPYKYHHPLFFLPSRNKNKSLTTPSILVSSFSFSLRFFESWHLKHSPSTPSSWLSLRHFSSPSPPLKICLRRRLQDPMPELPDLFQALWPWLELRLCFRCSPYSSTESCLSDESMVDLA